MKNILALLVITFLGQQATAQRITYAEILNDDSRNMSFEILGNFNDNYLIYKNNDRKHRVTVYGNDMTIKDDVRLDFLPEKVFNLDFVSYPSTFIMVYQYQRGGSVFCDAALLDANAKLINTPIHLDTTKIGFFSENKIYYLTHSENRKRILLYKMQNRNNNFYLNSFLFDENLKKLEATSTTFDFNERKESYGDLEVDNAGNFYFIKETNKNRAEFTSSMELNYHKFNGGMIDKKPLPLNDFLVQDVRIKIDNLNDLIFVNSFAYRKNQGNAEGIFSIAINKESLTQRTSAYVPFSDTLKSKLSQFANSRTAFDNFYIKNVVAKKDSGILVTIEDYSVQNRSNQRFNRFGFFDPYGYNFANPGFYRFQQRGFYDDFYSPYNNFNQRDLLYSYNDIIMISLDKNLAPQWETIINKKQSDVQNDNFLSFSTANIGGEIHYLFLQKDNNKQLISDHAIQPSGNLVRYATIKTGERGFNFMPRLAKQIGARQIIIPCTFRNSISFAKINF